MNKKWLVAMLGAAAMTMSAGAIAQQQMSGWYIGGDIGQSDVGPEDDTSFRFFGGYQINRNFSAEVGYGMLFDKGGVEISSLEISALGKFPLTNNFSIFGKLGFASTTVEFLGFDDDDTDLTYGFGVQYDVNRNFAVRGMWQQYKQDILVDDVDVLSLGVIYRF